MNGSLTRWLPPPDPSGPITCAACGCRMTETYLGDLRVWEHFSSMHADQDARGCRPACLGALHGRDGRALTAETIADARSAVAFHIDTLVTAEEGAAA